MKHSNSSQLQFRTSCNFFKQVNRKHETTRTHTNQLYLAQMQKLITLKISFINSQSILKWSERKLEEGNGVKPDRCSADENNGTMRVAIRRVVTEFEAVLHEWV